MADQNRPSGRRGSVLTQTQHGLLGLLMALAVFMVANALYLLANRLADAAGWTYLALRETSLPKLFQAMVLSHTGVGLLLSLGMVGFGAWHLPRVWARRHTTSVVTGVGFVAAGVALTITGLFIMTAAASRQHAWIWWTHALCGLAAPVLYVVHRRVAAWRPIAPSYWRFSAATLALLAIALVVHVRSHRDIVLTAEAEAARARGTYTGPGSRERDVASFATGPFVPAGFVPPESPFFPAATTTTTGGFLPSRIITRGDIASPEKLAPDLDRQGFVTETRIGADTCARCHPDTVEQWARSAHRFASFNNPFYEAAITVLREKNLRRNRPIDRHLEHHSIEADRIGMVKSKWCSGCHDPALLLAGNMDRPIDRRTAQAQAGLTCLACHAIDKIHNNTGNGNYNIADDQEDPYLFADAKSGLAAFLHDTAVKAKPAVHKRQMLKPFFRTSEFCATCHKVSLDVPVNTYRWLRGQDEYDNWHDSGVARNASRTFYLPGKARVCQDCHMPREPAPLGDVSAKNGTVRSHRFLAVNTALPFVRGDTETIERIEAFLRDEKLRVEVFAVRPADGEPTLAIAETKPVLRPGDAMQFDVVVRNTGVGHTFPGGTNDSNEAWLEVTMLDGEGGILARSGALGPDGHVDPAAHFYKALLVDQHGNAIHQRNAQDIRTPIYTRVIGPGTADVAHYAFSIPQAVAGDRVTVRARLLWRKFDRRFTEFVFETNRKALVAFDGVPELPVTEIAAHEVTLSVGAPPADSRAAAFGATDWVRFNDYGIGLLLQGDTRGADRAFQRVADLAPERLDGPANLARVALRDGNLARAATLLAQCEKLHAGHPQIAWFWGVLHQEAGSYQESADAYERVLWDFPDDRAAWMNRGRVLYLNGEYEKALAALDQVLRIDPESRQAHWHRKLTLTALGRRDEAAVAQARFEKYQIDESAQEVARAYRDKHPHDNLETQAIHVHKLEPHRATSAVAPQPGTRAGASE